MKLLVLKFDESVDLSAFTVDADVTITSPAAVAGKVLANAAVASDPPTIDGTYNTTAVTP